MLGIIYIILSCMAGKELVMLFMPSPEPAPDKKIPLRLVLAGAFGVGTLVFGWATYMISWAASAAGAVHPLFFGNLVVMTVSAAILLYLYIKKYRSAGTEVTGSIRKWITDSKGSRKEIIFFGLLFVFILWIMFYVFYIWKDTLYMGFTVYGDYAPHTAMMRSFSLGNNFPTEYPHFGGQDVKYHFMFQFYVGNLEYLGLRMDIAYNLVSALGLWGFLVILYQLAIRLTGSSLAGCISIVFFFFRSALTFFQFIWEHLKAGDFLITLKENTSFIGYTTNENWGLWNFNVYLNQRHLGFVLLLVALVIFFFLDWVEAGADHPEKGILWFKNRLFTKEAWKSKNMESALLAGLILGLATFWNGAAVIGGLLILFGFAIFSDGKIDYAVTAFITVLFSVLQAKIFIWGNAVDTTFFWGFLSEDKSIQGVLWYLVQMSGVFFVGALLLLFLLKKRTQKIYLFSCLLPVIFAFTISMTPDIAVNHKYIMIAYAFLVIIWGWAVAELFKRKLWGRILALVLVVCLTVTGAYDFVIILRNNGQGHRVAVNMDSSLTDWLAETLTHKDLLLTPEYSVNEVTMSGVMMYMGWPYYAWSAGYDTYGRAQKAETIYTSSDAAEIKQLVKQEKITYILYEDGMEYEGLTCREDVIADTFQLVYQSNDGRIRIYET